MNLRSAITPLLLTLSVACAAVEAPRAPLAERVGDPIPRAWSRPLPEGFDDFALYALGACALVVAWPVRDEPSGERLVRCYDAEDGHTRWETRLKAMGPYTLDHLTHVGDTLIFAHGAEAHGIDTGSGEVRWTFDAADRSIEALDTVEDLVVLELGHKTLAVLRAESGAWVRGLSTGERRLLRVAPDADGPVALLAEPTSKQQPTPTLVAVSLLGEGGEDAEPPWPEAEPLWRHPVPPTVGDIAVIGDVFVASFAPGTLTFLDPSSGEVLREEALVTARSARASRGRFRGVFKGSGRSAPSSDDAALRSTLLPLHAGVLLADGPELVVQSEEQGLLMELLYIQGRRPRDLSIAWELALDWSAAPTSRQDLDRGDVSVLISPSRLAFIDARDGRLLQQLTLDARRARWRRLATDGRAVFLLFTQGKKRRLEARPL